MQKGSSNYERQLVKIARLHAKAKHERQDFLHQISARLTDTYDIISIEDLDISAIKKTLTFGKSISDNGWGMFVNFLEEKAYRKGKLVIKVSKWFPSSKTCSVCGHVHKELTLKDRTYECPVCGNIIDRDKQAAININKEGLRIFADSYLSNEIKPLQLIQPKKQVSSKKKDKTKDKNKSKTEKKSKSKSKGTTNNKKQTKTKKVKV